MSPLFCSVCHALASPCEHYRRFQILPRKFHLSLHIVCKLAYLLLVSWATVTACYMSIAVYMSIAASWCHCVCKLLLLSFNSPFKEHAAMWSRSFKYAGCAMMNFHSRSHLVIVAELITGWSLICCLSSLGFRSVICYQSCNFCYVCFSPLLNTWWILLPCPFTSGMANWLVLSNEIWVKVTC